ncbi:MAG: hypothetical protein E7434_07430 [Ruminococcaceae bacterium]|nr:hypothetical protein [Oscillospiraceae bacterium]
MTVYVDAVLALNFCVNYLLLRGTARLGASAARRRNSALAALLGAAYAVAVYVPSLAWLRLFPMKLIVAGLMLLCAFGMKRSTWRLAAVFAVLSLVLCGAIFGVQMLQGKPFLYKNSLLFPVSFASVLLTAFAVSLACRLLLPRLSHAANSVIRLEVTVDGKTVEISALRDSGNTLVDPVSGKDVLTANWAVAGILLPEKLSAQDFLQPAVLALRLKKYAPRLIPYRAVGVENGLLLALPCKITHNDHTVSSLIAFSPTPLSDGGAYDALTGGMIYA